MNRRLGALGALFAVFLLANGAGAAAGDAVPLGKLPVGVVPTHYKIDLTIVPTQDRFSGRTEIEVTFAKPSRAIYLHGLDLRMTEASVVLSDGRTMRATYKQVDDSGVVQLSFADEVPAGQAKLVFVYDAPFGTSLDGLYKVMDRGDAYAFTQFESISARKVFPSFDEPGFKTPFDISVTAPKADKVVGNTPIASATPASDGMTKNVFETTKPLPTYLVALAIGPLDIVDGGDIPANKYRDHPIHLRGVTAKGNGPRIAYALSITPATVTALENYFGVSYPYQKLDILAVPDFAAGAMENAAAITFRERLLLMNTDAPMDQKRASLTVIAHELTHQWFGDLVTPAWWDDTWLNESFATWMEYKAAQVVKPGQEYGRSTLQSGLRVMDLDELASARQIHQPVNNADDIENSFDDITYSKGGAVLSMFESYVGEEQWRAGIHAYLNKFAWGNGTAHDFIGAIADTTHRPEIVAAFDSFIDQPGVPLLQVEASCVKKSAAAHVAQSMYTYIGRNAPDRHWQVPMCMQAQGGKKLCQLVDQPADIKLGAACPKSVMPNAAGKGYYRFALGENGWQALIANAPKLNGADQLTLFYNVNAALHADKASSRNFFDALMKLAPNARWDLLGEMDSNTLGSMDDSLRDLRMNILTSADLPAYRALVAKLFGPRLAAIGLNPKPNETPGDGLARAGLLRIMVEEARDEKLIAALAHDAQVFVASGGKDANELSSALMPEAIRAGLMSQGPAFGDAVLGLYGKSNDENFRRSLVHAMASSEDTAFLNKYLALALTPQVRTGELLYLYQFWPREPVARAALWSWFKANFDAIMKRVSAYSFARAPGMLATACDESTRADLDAFLGPKAKDLVGTPHTLAVAEEKISRCVAFRQAKSAELVSALHAAAGQ